jgi:hypothetical protein
VQASHAKLTVLWYACVAPPMKHVQDAATLLQWASATGMRQSRLSCSSLQATFLSGHTEGCSHRFSKEGHQKARPSPGGACRLSAGNCHCVFRQRAGVDGLGAGLGSWWFFCLGSTSCQDRCRRLLNSCQTVAKQSDSLLTKAKTAHAQVEQQHLLDTALACRLHW